MTKRIRQRDTRDPYGRTKRVGTCRAPRCDNELQSLSSYGLCGYHLIELFRTIERFGGPESLPEWEHLWIPKRREERERLQSELGITRHDPDLDPPLLTAPEPKRTAKGDSDGSLYFIRVGSYIKIGWTSDLAKRMRQYPPDTVLLASQPGTRKDEHRLHKRFAVHRSHGREWYPLVPAILEYIEAVKREHGQPEQPHFSARPVEVPRPHAQAGYINPKGYVTSGGKTLRG